MALIVRIQKTASVVETYRLQDISDEYHREKTAL